MQGYKLALYGLAIAFAASDAGAATISAARAPVRIKSAPTAANVRRAMPPADTSRRATAPRLSFGQNSSKTISPPASMPSFVQPPKPTEPVDAYTRRETDKIIADAVADVLRQQDIGLNAGDVVAVESNGKINPTLYDQGEGNLPTAPNDGKEYVLMATSSGSKEWVIVQDDFVKNW